MKVEMLTATLPLNCFSDFLRHAMLCVVPECSGGSGFPGLEISCTALKPSRAAPFRHPPMSSCPSFPPIPYPYSVLNTRCLGPLVSFPSVGLSVAATNCDCSSRISAYRCSAFPLASSFSCLFFLLCPHTG